MAKYYFNPDSLQYEQIENTTRDRWFAFMKFTLLVSLLSVVVLKVSEDVVQSPKLKKLTAERQEIAYELQLLNRDLQQYQEHLDRIAYNDDHLYRVFFEVDPIPVTKREAGTGGSQQYRQLRNKPNSGLLVEANKNLDDVARQLVIQSKSFDEVIDLARHKEQHMAAKPSIQPVSINELIRFGSSYGMRMHPILNQYRYHNGIDLTAPRGTKIYATADGVVVQANYTTGGYGKKIMIDHGYGYKTLYGHCYKILVERGQKVKRGEVIGLVGNTGLSTRSHLHYEVWVNNRAVNPINYYANDLSPDEYDRMINLLSKADPSFDIN
ncbi:MAG: M23 family metallopeptidase [Bacteroidales bacterium]|nr:M23 family metallopeptidase [Bacteroidales bacterium]MDT8431547.1 M23 family metallopeptidase [Bacteroidales bacterium]